MEKKKIIPIILISALIVLGVSYLLINNNQSSSIIHKDVCSYLSETSPYDCDNHECKIKSEDDNY